MDLKIIRWIRYTQFPIAIIIYVFFALIPEPQSYVRGNYSDLALHTLGNFLLMSSAWLIVLDKRRPLLLALMIALPISILVEISQSLTDVRTPDVKDLFANFFGLAIGFILCGTFQFTIRRWL